MPVISFNLIIKAKTFIFQYRILSSKLLLEILGTITFVRYSSILPVVKKKGKYVCVFFFQCFSIAIGGLTVTVLLIFIIMGKSR